MQYAHGGDIYTYKNLLDFSINVNPLGPADAVVEAAARSLQRIGEYPDSQSRELRNALAEKKGLAAEQFVIGNGAADLLFSLVLAEKPQKAMIVIPAFSEYEQAHCAKEAPPDVPFCISGFSWARAERRSGRRPAPSS